jgi:hypothetical protein
MKRSQFTISRLLAVIGACGIVLAGLQSGSNDWFKLIYTLTFLSLVYAAIAARYWPPFWFGAAIAGWAYFLIGFGPWIGSPPGSEPLHAVNRNIITSVILESVSGMIGASDRAQAGTGVGTMGAGAIMIHKLRSANRDGIMHCALTVLFACGGGLIAKRLARSG